MNKVKVKCVTVLAFATVTLLMAGAANATIIATFADPTVGGTVSPMFDVRNTGPGVGRVAVNSGGNTVDLQVVGTTYNNAILTFDDIGYTGTYQNGLLDAGEFNFLDSSSNLILKITFGSGDVSIRSLGGDNIFGTNSVQFSGPAVASLGTLADESFSFSFAHQTKIMNGSTIIGFTSTASFTSSAVPEPAAISVLSLGAVLMTLRRRRR